jgi:hypothetical protein
MARASYVKLNLSEPIQTSYPEPMVPRGYEEPRYNYFSGVDQTEIQSSDMLTKRNHDAIQYQIELTNQQVPFFPTKNLIRSVTTDMDHFPYTRFYRGNPRADMPTIMEREAGFRKKLDCYKPEYVVDEGPFPNVCFEVPCSTTYPCNPDYVQKFGDSNKINLWVNKTCVSKMP